MAIIDTKTLSFERFHTAYLQMSKERQTQCDALSEPAQYRCVAADMAVRSLVNDWSKDAQGKPICQEGYISLSHSGEYAVAVHSDRPIGVDIQQLRPLSPALTKRLGDEPLTAFVKKEALAKALGVGVYRLLDAPFPDGWDFSFPTAPEGYLLVVREKQP